MKKLALVIMSMLLILASVAQATIWATSNREGELYNFDDNGRLQFVVRGLNNPSRVTLDPNTGNVMVLVSDNKELLVVTPSGAIPVHVGPDSMYNPDLTWPLDVTSDSESNMWIADADSIIKLDKFGSVIFKITGIESVKFPSDIEYSASDDTIVVIGRNELGKYNTHGKLVYRITGFNSPKDLAIQASSGIIAVADTYNSVVKLFSSQGSLLHTLNAGVRLPSAVAFNNNGEVWIVNTLNRKIMRFDQYGKHLGDDIINSEIGVPTEVYVDSTSNDLVIIDKEQLWHITPEGKVRLTLSFDQPVNDVALDFGARSSFVPTQMPAPILSDVPYKDIRSEAAPVQRKEAIAAQDVITEQPSVPTKTVAVAVSSEEDEETQNEVKQLRQQVADQRETMNDLLAQQKTEKKPGDSKDNSEIIAVLVVTFLILLILAFLGGMMLRKKKQE